MNDTAAHTCSTYTLLTGTAPAAIAIVRLSGPAVAEFVGARVRSPSGRPIEGAALGRVSVGVLTDSNGAVIDEIVLSVHSGVPVRDVRLHLHGNPTLLQRVTDVLESAGFQAASHLPRDGLWGGIDRIEAEALALVPQMRTPAGVAWLLAQVGAVRGAVRDACAAPETSARMCSAMVSRAERAAWFTTPLRIALLGPPNAGKSTLVNALAGQTVSVVDPTPGTTRDWVAAAGEVGGFPVEWIDTAGLGATDDPLAAAAGAQTRAAADSAEAVVVVLDATAPASTGRAAFVREHADLTPACVFLNKCDRADALAGVADELPDRWRAQAVRGAGLVQDGLDALGAMVLAAAGRSGVDLAAPTAFSPALVAALQEAADADGPTGVAGIQALVEAG